MLRLLCIAAAMMWPCLSPDAAAQENALESRLASASRIECRFTAKVTGDWPESGPTADLEEADLEASFYEVDVDGGTAEAQGQFGSTYIVVRYSYGYLHFLQMSNVGPLHVTTVLAREAADGRLMAVHTRHEYSPTVLPGFTSRPEMYLGDCAITD